MLYYVHGTYLLLKSLFFVFVVSLYSQLFTCILVEYNCTFLSAVCTGVHTLCFCTFFQLYVMEYILSVLCTVEYIFSVFTQCSYDHVATCFFFFVYSVECKAVLSLSFPVYVHTSVHIRLLGVLCLVQVCLCL